MSAPTRTALGEPAQAPTPISGAGTTTRELPGSGGVRTGAVGSSNIIHAQYATFPPSVARSAKLDEKILLSRAGNSTKSTKNLGSTTPDRPGSDRPQHQTAPHQMAPPPQVAP